MTKLAQLALGSTPESDPEGPLELYRSNKLPVWIGNKVASPVQGSHGGE